MAWVGSPDDLVDWLAGNDEAVTARQAEQRRAQVEAVVAEIGEMG